MVASVTAVTKYNHVLGVLVASPGVSTVMDFEPIPAVTELAAMLGAPQGLGPHFFPVRA